MTESLNISEFSVSVFKFLTDVFSFNLGYSKEEMNFHFFQGLSKFTDESEDAEVSIYYIPSKQKSFYGNDVDLFMEEESGQYRWYALKTNIMHFNGAYKDLKFNPKAKEQVWDRLLRHEQNFGSKSYYLFYSGKTRSLHELPESVREDFLGKPTLPEVGLGIVETSEIKRIRENEIKPYGLFYFHHVFPEHMDSIRKLFGGKEFMPSTSKVYSLQEALPSAYKQLKRKHFDIAERLAHKKVDMGSTSGLAPIRIIVKRNLY
ncbi:hypothetical protein [Aureibacter tunicatorum]|uniref:Uncharacterized protein n=1 Tax=Aureibacter tunicatorum TaxID=866807 RepID=A0AAE4BSG6_9BACT|nr:hypothetical protein [Aureibacter tunicatorum]MDR6238840.1 hypothetical protein [Aureibacter tunicatorum]BDD05233.1 hypothetical protein AUTU_27160 [Aureibacter tunicatorum]